MERVTQTTAATAEECAATSEELSAQASTALGLVAELRTAIAGHESDAIPVGRPAPRLARAA